jgi:hypothetical protein
MRSGRQPMHTAPTLGSAGRQLRQLRGPRSLLPFAWGDSERLWIDRADVQSNRAIGAFTIYCRQAVGRPIQRAIVDIAWCQRRRRMLDAARTRSAWRAPMH